MSTVSLRTPSNLPALSVLVIGLGRIAWLLEDDPKREKPASHVGALLNTAGLTLLAGCDPVLERRKAFAERFKVPVWQDAKTAMVQSKPDIVCIAADSDAHYQLLLTCLEFPLKLIICEKPLTPQFSSAKKIVRLAQKKAVQILVNHERRYSDDYRAVKDLIDSARYGSLLALHARLYFGRTRAVDSMLWHDGCHLFDIIRFLLADQDISYQLARQSCHSMLASAVVNNCLVSVEAGKGRDHLHFELDLSFERGRARVGNGIFELSASTESAFYSQYRSLSEETKTWQGPTGYFSHMMEDALACGREPGRVPISSATTELATLKVLHRLCKLLAA